MALCSASPRLSSSLLLLSAPFPTSVRRIFWEILSIWGCENNSRLRTPFCTAYLPSACCSLKRRLVLWFKPLSQQADNHAPEGDGNQGCKVGSNRRNYYQRNRKLAFYRIRLKVWGLGGRYFEDVNPTLHIWMPGFLSRCQKAEEEH